MKRKKREEKYNRCIIHNEISCTNTPVTSKFDIVLKTIQDYDKITSLKWMPKDNKKAIGLD
jgi:hypothetical protein